MFSRGCFGPHLLLPHPEKLSIPQIPVFSLTVLLAIGAPIKAGTKPAAGYTRLKDKSSKSIRLALIGALMRVALWLLKATYIQPLQQQELLLIHSVPWLALK